MILLKTRRDDHQDETPLWPHLADPRHRQADTVQAVRVADLLSVHGTGMAAQCLAPEQRLYARGASGCSAYVIASGIVRFERVTVAGQRRISRVAGRGDLIGQEALLSQAYRDDAVVCTPVALHRISAAVLQGADWMAAGLPIALMCRWQDTLDESEFWSTEVMTGPARRRVLQLLARLQRHQDDQGLIWMPKREQMADMLNMAVETCSRVLSALRRDGVLALEPPRQARLDRGRLAEALRCSNH